MAPFNLQDTINRALEKAPNAIGYTPKQITAIVPVEERPLSIEEALKLLEPVSNISNYQRPGSCNGVAYREIEKDPYC